MNIVYSIVYMLAVIGLLLVSVLLSESLYLRSPTGVLMLFGVGLFMSLGFLLFGHIRFDEQPCEEHDETRCALKRMNPLKKICHRENIRLH